MVILSTVKKVKNKTINVRKQLKVKLENTAARYKNAKGFKPTQQQAYQWFRYINRALFNSRLPIVEIQIKKFNVIYNKLFTIGGSSKNSISLKKLAKEFRRHLYHNGTLVISGITKCQKNDIINLYSKFNLKLVKSIYIENWISIIFKKV